MIECKVQFKQTVEITAWTTILADSKDDALDKVNRMCTDRGYDRFMLEDAADCGVLDRDVIECSARLLEIYG